LELLNYFQKLILVNKLPPPEGANRARIPQGLTIATPQVPS